VGIDVVLYMVGWVRNRREKKGTVLVVIISVVVVVVAVVPCLKTGETLGGAPGTAAID